MCFRDHLWSSRRCLWTPLLGAVAQHPSLVPEHCNGLRFPALTAVRLDHAD